MKVEVQISEEIKEHWILFIEGEKWMTVHRSIFGRKLSFKAVHSWKEWEELFSQVEYQRARNYAFWRLSTQSYHSEQLAKLLKERLVRLQTIKKVIGECKQIGSLNDEEWISAFIHANQKRCSFRLILNKLRLKGLKAETIKGIAERNQNSTDELETLRHLISTRYFFTKDVDLKTRQKRMQALLRKGFQYDQIQQVLQEL